MFDIGSTLSQCPLLEYNSELKFFCFFFKSPLPNYFNHITIYFFNIGRSNVPISNHINCACRHYYVLIKAIASYMQLKEQNTQ